MGNTIPHGDRLHECSPSCSEYRGDFGMPTLGGDMFKAILYPDHLGMDFGDEGYTVEAETDDAKYVLNILPDIIERFLKKNSQYARAQTGHDLGVKGIIPDVNRKTSALISRFWDSDGIPRDGEDSTEELIGDLMGHLLLMLAKMRDAPEWMTAPGKLYD